MAQTRPPPPVVLGAEDYRKALRSGFRDGERADCGWCGAAAVFQRGLTFQGRGRTGLVTVANLGAFVCVRCDSRSYDPPSGAAIEQTLEANRPGFGARAKVSRLAGRTVGVYFPKALQEHMNIHAGDELVLQPIDDALMLVEVRHPHPQEVEAAGSLADAYDGPFRRAAEEPKLAAEDR